MKHLITIFTIWILGKWKELTTKSYKEHLCYNITDRLRLNKLNFVNTNLEALKSDHSTLGDLWVCYILPSVFGILQSDGRTIEDLKLLILWLDLQLKVCYGFLDFILSNTLQKK